MMAVTSFMDSLVGTADRSPPFMPVRSEGLAHRQHDGALAQLLAEGIGHALVVVVGVDVIEAEIEAAEGLRDADAVVDVRVTRTRHALDLLVADVRAKGVALRQREFGAEVEVVRVLAVDRAEEIGERVRVLQAEEFPGALDVGLERIGAVEATGIAARVVVVEQAEVVAEFAGSPGVAAVE